MKFFSGKAKKGTVYASANGKLTIRDTDYYGESVRVLMVDGVRESASYNTPEKQNELISEYTMGFNRILEIFPTIKDALLIGGAGFSYPKYYISHFPEKRMDVVEIDARMVDLAMKYFYLDTLFTTYRLSENERLRIFVADGADYLASSEHKYDVIFNDAYTGITPDKRLLSDAGVYRIKQRLQKDGIYALNLITSLSGTYAMSGIMAQATLHSYFENTVVLPCSLRRSPEEKQNCIIVASDRSLDPISI